MPPFNRRSVLIAAITTATSGAAVLSQALLGSRESVGATATAVTHPPEALAQSAVPAPVAAPPVLAGQAALDQQALSQPASGQAAPNQAALPVVANPQTPQIPAAPARVAASLAPPRWQRFAVPRPHQFERPAITIVIDDLGVMRAATERVLAMPAPLTLSWFPFARNLEAQVVAAAARGHEMTLHMPMQSYGLSTAWTGPDPLRVDLPEAVNVARLRAAIAAVPSTVGVNNHMGSVATRDPALMAIVARECKAAGMLFLDSVVVTHSCGYSAAHDAGVPAASRDVFIDHSPDPRMIREQLAQIEAQALRRGHVIAIGHPWPHTIAALEEWLPTLQAKGFSLWPLSAMVARRNDIRMPDNLAV